MGLGYVYIKANSLIVEMIGLGIGELENWCNNGKKIFRIDEMKFILKSVMKLDSSRCLVS
jgi:hypothetical protein